MTRVIRPLRNGQITIPAAFRKALGIDTDTLLQLTLAQGELRIKPVQVEQEPQGSPWLQDAYDAFAPLRAELAEKYSEEEINAAIDQALDAVRRTNA